MKWIDFDELENQNDLEETEDDWDESLFDVLKREEETDQDEDEDEDEDADYWALPEEAYREVTKEPEEILDESYFQIPPELLEEKKVSRKKEDTKKELMFENKEEDIYSVPAEEISDMSVEEKRLQVERILGLRSMEAEAQEPAREEQSSEPEDFVMETEEQESSEIDLNLIADIMSQNEEPAADRKQEAAVPAEKETVLDGERAEPKQEDEKKEQVYYNPLEFETDSESAEDTDVQFERFRQKYLEEHLLNREKEKQEKADESARREEEAIHEMESMKRSPWAGLKGRFFKKENKKSVKNDAADEVQSDSEDMPWFVEEFQRRQEAQQGTDSSEYSLEDNIDAETESEYMEELEYDISAYAGAEAQYEKAEKPETAIYEGIEREYAREDEPYSASDEDLYTDHTRIPEYKTKIEAGAESVQRQAESAQKYAESVQRQAESAQKYAESAQKYAESVQRQAESAQQQEPEALVSSDTTLTQVQSGILKKREYIAAKHAQAESAPQQESETAVNSETELTQIQSGILKKREYKTAKHVQAESAQRQAESVQRQAESAQRQAESAQQQESGAAINSDTKLTQIQSGSGEKQEFRTANHAEAEFVQTQAESARQRESETAVHEALAKGYAQEEKQKLARQTERDESRKLPEENDYYTGQETDLTDISIDENDFEEDVDEVSADVVKIKSAHTDKKYISAEEAVDKKAAVADNKASFQSHEKIFAAEKQALAAENKVFSAERKSSGAEKQSSAIERRALTAERKSSGAEKQASATERRALTVERKSSDAENQSSATERKALTADRENPVSVRKNPDMERTASVTKRKTPTVKRENPDTDQKDSVAARKVPAAPRESLAVKEETSSAVRKATTTEEKKSNVGRKVVRTAGAADNSERKSKEISLDSASQKSVIKKPVTQKPATQKPVTQKPVTQKPVTQKPATQKPVTQKPATQKPVTQKSVTQKPAAAGKPNKTEVKPAANRDLFDLEEKAYTPRKQKEELAGVLQKRQIPNRYRRNSVHDRLAYARQKEKAQEELSKESITVHERVAIVPPEKNIPKLESVFESEFRNQTEDDLYVRKREEPGRQKKKKEKNDRWEKEENTPDRPIREFIGILVSIFVVVVVTFVLVEYVGQRTQVNGSSMETTLHDGDNLIVDKISYVLREPERFDIIVFPYKTATAEEETYYIKRIIALPGERVKVANGFIYINGSQLDEHYGKDNDLIVNPGLAEREIQLGEDEYFVLGDNRNNSSDSREIGNIKREDIVGRAWLRIYPFSKIGFLKHQ